MIQVLSYPIIFFVICPGSCFVLVLLFAFLFTSCFVLVCVLCSVICVFVYILFRSCLRLVFCYLRSCLHLVSFLFLSRSCSCFLCLSHFVSKKKSCKNFEKKSGCLIFEHEIEAFRGVFFLKKIVDQVPFSRFSSEF